MKTRITAALSWKTKFSRTAWLKVISILLAALTVPAACRSDRSDTGWMEQSFNMAPEIPATARDSARYLLQKTMQHNVPFQTFASNLAVKLKIGGLRIGMGGQLRIANDSTIWASIHKMGMELVRLKLTPDSLLMYSKAGNTAAVYTDEQDSLLEPVMPLIYRLCQNMLMQKNDTLLFNNPLELSRTKKNLWEVRGISDDSLSWTVLIAPRSFKIIQLDAALKDGNSEMQASFQYPDRNKTDIRLAQDRKELLHVEICYTDPQWDIPLAFPFQIPASIPVMSNHGLIKSMQKVENDFIRSEQTPNIEQPDSENNR